MERKIFIRGTLKNSVAANTQNAKTNDISSTDLGPIALFSEAKLITTSNEHLEKPNHLHLATLVHKILSFSAGTGDFICGFGIRINTRREE